MKRVDERRVWLYLDGELPADAARRFEADCAGDAALADALRTARAVERVLRRGAVAPPAPTRDLVGCARRTAAADRARPITVPRFGAGRRLYVAALAAAAGVAIVTGVGVYRGLHGGARPLPADAVVEQPPPTPPTMLELDARLAGISREIARLQQVVAGDRTEQQETFGATGHQPAWQRRARRVEATLNRIRAELPAPPKADVPPKGSESSRAPGSPNVRERMLEGKVCLSEVV